jgi:hypothetical protein
MLRWLATALIALLFILNIALPSTSIGRRGTEDRVRADVASAVGEIGKPLPEFELETLSGEIVRSSDLLGHRVLLIFERSVDW